MADRNSSQLCKNCLSRPVYVGNGQALDFCGNRCKTEFKNRGTPPVSPSVSRTPSSSVGDICKLAGCQNTVYVGGDGIASQFCSNRHRREAVQNGRADACLMCRKLPKAIIGGKQSDFCSNSCRNRVISQAPIILDVPQTHVTFDNVATQFRDQWRHPTAVPTVLKVWKIYGEKDINDKFARYKLEVERRTSLKGANTRRRWHGTVRTCRLGDEGNNLEFCSNGSCSLCSVIRSSFELTKAGQNTNFGRFGAGIYTSATSSKANDYIKELGGSTCKAMILSQVVMGRTVKLTREDQTLRQPPSGFDSVVGEPGGDLNYDESIVYTNDAIRPLFLVTFQE